MQRSSTDRKCRRGKADHNKSTADMILQITEWRLYTLREIACKCDKILNRALRPRHGSRLPPPFERWWNGRYTKLARCDWKLLRWQYESATYKVWELGNCEHIIMKLWDSCTTHMKQWATLDFWQFRKSVIYPQSAASRISSWLWQNPYQRGVHTLAGRSPLLSTSWASWGTVLHPHWSPHWTHDRISLW